MNEDSYRAFIALELPPDIREAIWDSVKPISGTLRSLVKWVPSENMHLTLRFLGNITLAMSNTLRKNLQNISPRFTPPKFKLGITGTFPSWKEPRVLWVGLEVIEGDLKSIQNETELQAQAIGLPQEKQKFHPHITVGRVKTPSPFISTTWKNVKIKETSVFTIDKITLFRSTLNPSGAVYEVIDTFPLRREY